jgi:hypothetical protein
LKKYPNIISDRLDIIRLSSLNSETIKETEIAIKEETQRLKTFNQDVKSQEKTLKSLKFITKAKVKVANSLFDEFRQPKELNGINIWEGPEEINEDELEVEE